ncbi:MAG: filamentous hemagglutinin N-terminal domain-containing protein, partial [Planktomarina sp.]
MQTKTRVTKLISKAVVLTFLPLVIANVANAQTLPTGATVVAGDLSFSGGATYLDVTQTSATGIINWDTFSIGAGDTVSFDNGSGSTLNRVTGNQMSEIMGMLTATGSLYLVNENGVVFGPNGVVNTGGDFIVSTLDVSDVDYLNGGSLEFTGNAAANIRNYGSLFSANGDIAIISREVINEGVILAPNGRASLIAGRDVLMRDSSVDDGRFLVRIGHATDAVYEQGIIEAAEVELATNGGNIYALAGNNSGHIQATGVANRGGRVFLTAGSSGNVQVSKTVRVRKSNGSGGTINLAAANFTVDGTLDASGDTGLGGVVDLLAEVDANFSGSILAYGDGSPNTGGVVSVSGLGSVMFSGDVLTGGGVLVIDPADIEINANGAPGTPDLIGASEINTGSLVTALNSGDVIIHTGAAGAASGTINVADDIFYSSAFDLTLLANGDITVLASIVNDTTTGGDINLVAGWDGTVPAVFDSAAYNALDLTTLTEFGQANGVAYNHSAGEMAGGGPYTASGSVFIGNDNQLTPIEVGSRSGDTNVYANDVYIVGGAQTAGTHTQLGFQSVNQGAGSNVTGDLRVRAVGNVGVYGGLNADNYVMIGHG